MELLASFCLCFLKKPVRQDGVYGAVTKLPQIRYVAYLTMVLYFIYAAIEYHVAADQQVLRLFLYGWLGHSRRAARHSAARLANSQWC